MTFADEFLPRLRFGLAAALTFAAVTVPQASGQSIDPVVDALSVNALKGAYVDCERAAMNNQLDTVEIMRCSVIYEELKRRAFDGDYRKLRSWWDARKGSSGEVVRDMKSAGELAGNAVPGLARDTC